MIFTMSEPIWLHPAPIDFRKQIDGIIVLVSDRLALNPASGMVYQIMIGELVDSSISVNGTYITGLIAAVEDILCAGNNLSEFWRRLISRIAGK